MTISWTIVEGIVRLQSGDDATFEEWRAAVDEFRRHPDYRPGMGVLNDWQKRTRSITAQDAQARTSYMVQYGAAFGPTRWAVVVFARRRLRDGLGRGGPLGGECQTSRCACSAISSRLRPGWGRQMTKAGASNTDHVEKQ